MIVDNLCSNSGGGRLPICSSRRDMMCDRCTLSCHFVSIEYHLHGLISASSLRLSNEKQRSVHIAMPRLHFISYIAEELSVGYDKIDGQEMLNTRV